MKNNEYMKVAIEEANINMKENFERIYKRWEEYVIWRNIFNTTRDFG
jgi:hypothetical protein